MNFPSFGCFPHIRENRAIFHLPFTRRCRSTVQDVLLGWERPLADAPQGGRPSFAFCTVRTFNKCGLAKPLSQILLNCYRHVLCITIGGLSYALPGISVQAYTRLLGAQYAPIRSNADEYLAVLVAAETREGFHGKVRYCS